MMNGGPISWKSRRQDNVSLSTSETEFVAASQAGQEAIYLRETLNDFGFSQTQAFVGLPMLTTKMSHVSGMSHIHICVDILHILVCMRIYFTPLFAIILHICIYMYIHICIT